MNGGTEQGELCVQRTMLLIDLIGAQPFGFIGIVTPVACLDRAWYTL